MDGNAVEVQVALAGGGVVFLAEPGEEDAPVSLVEAAA
jgi:hypothetical protein